MPSFTISDILQVESILACGELKVRTFEFYDTNMKSKRKASWVVWNGGVVKMVAQHLHVTCLQKNTTERRINQYNTMYNTGIEVQS